MTFGQCFLTLMNITPLIFSYAGHIYTFWQICDQQDLLLSFVISNPCLHVFTEPTWESFHDCMTTLPRLLPYLGAFLIPRYYSDVVNITMHIADFPPFILFPGVHSPKEVRHSSWLLGSSMRGWEAKAAMYRVIQLSRCWTEVGWWAGLPVCPSGCTALPLLPALSSRFYELYPGVPLPPGFHRADLQEAPLGDGKMDRGRRTPSLPYHGVSVCVLLPKLLSGVYSGPQNPSWPCPSRFRAARGLPAARPGCSAFPCWFSITQPVPLQTVVIKFSSVTYLDLLCLLLATRSLS